MDVAASIIMVDDWQHLQNAWFDTVIIVSAVRISGRICAALFLSAAVSLLSFCRSVACGSEPHSLSRYTLEHGATSDLRVV